MFVLFDYHVSVMHSVCVVFDCYVGAIHCMCLCCLIVRLLLCTVFVLFKLR